MPPVIQLISRRVQVSVKGSDRKHQKVSSMYTWSSEPTSYLGVPLQHCRDNTTYWCEKAQEIRERTGKLERGGRNLSIFARVKISSVFLVAKIWYIMQALYCFRVNIQEFGRISALFEFNVRKNLPQQPFQETQGAREAGQLWPIYFSGQPVSGFFSFCGTSLTHFCAPLCSFRWVMLQLSFWLLMLLSLATMLVVSLREVVFHYRLTANFFRDILSSWGSYRMFIPRTLLSLCVPCGPSSGCLATS